MEFVASVDLTHLKYPMDRICEAKRPQRSKKWDLRGVRIDVRPVLRESPVNVAYESGD